MTKLSEALNLYHYTVLGFERDFGFRPTHLRCSFPFRDALHSSGDFVLIGTRNIYVPFNGIKRVSPRFYIEEIMIDCVLKYDEMKLEVVDSPDFHSAMMEAANYEL